MGPGERGDAGAGPPAEGLMALDRKVWMERGGYAGLGLLSIGWLAIVSAPTVAYSSLVVPFVLAGAGMALVFAPAANAVLGAVRPEIRSTFAPSDTPKRTLDAAMIQTDRRLRVAQLTMQLARRKRNHGCSE